MWTTLVFFAHSQALKATNASYSYFLTRSF